MLPPSLRPTPPMRPPAARDRPARLGLSLMTLLVLTACATVRPDATLAPAAPLAWTTPLPHGGTRGELTGWWQRQGDPLLAELVAAAQAASPNVAQAASRIAQARATRTAAGAALLPTVDATASAQRGPLTNSAGAGGGAPIGTTLQAGLQTQWEIDLFGANASARDAADAQLAARQLQWHDARVAVAAEVATAYVRQTTCQRQLAVVRADTASRTETARLADLSAGAGFQAPATAALARASAAEGAVRTVQQAASCASEIQALVALTGLPAAELTSKLAAAPAPSAPFATFLVAEVPAVVLAQRPDVRAAQAAVAEAAADVGTADAQRYPRLTLGGSIGRGRVRSGGASADLETWAIGPLSLSVPLFDGGRRAANADAARARYDEAAALLAASARQAVREVEEALIAQDSAARRAPNVEAAARGYAQSLAATEARYRGGLASLVELEDARRLKLAADTTLVELDRDRRTAWISLYRAAGGGWTEADPSPDGRRTR